jgi:hypothetical protein
MKPATDLGVLVPIDPAQLDRLDQLIEQLMELRDILDGDADLEPEHHDGGASFPSSPLYAITDPLALAGGPGDPSDAEQEPDEDSDADEWSGVIVWDQNGRWRWA